MPSLPPGTVTFLFTDIEGSTRVLQELGDRYAEVLVDHRRLLRAAFQTRGGQEIDTQGDAFFYAFPRARDALEATITAQRAIAAHAWPGGINVRVRMGLHTGEPLSSDAGYVGMAVHRAARICAAAHGGQILLSQATRELIEDDLPDGIGLRDLGEHRLKDLARPLRLFQAIVAGLPADFPPLKSLDALPNNLPIQLTSFIGREREKAEVKRLVAPTRILTITGSGGAGKTRLALQVGAELLDEFKDGVWLVDLAPLSDANLVPQAVARTLNIREQAGRTVMAVLIDYIQGRELLLVLDNCEHLVAACAQAADALLRACPKLRILTTSRERLGVAGETAWRIPSLPTPDPMYLPPLDQLAQNESVRLFIERAVSASPTFIMTTEDAQAVASICRQLDGIPLAVELAAARVAVLSPEQIASKLAGRLDLLRGSRTALPRHQTLRAALDWSYDLLSEPERRLFRSLSVFAGGFTLDAAEAICGGPDGDDFEALDLLAQLVDKSLIVAERQNGQMRYRLLEPIRQYGSAQLQGAGEATHVQKRHLDFFLSLAKEANSRLRGTEQAIWFRRLSADYDNIREALSHGLAGGQIEEVLRLGASLWWFWWLRGPISEGRRRLEEALAKSGAKVTAMRAEALLGAGFLAAEQGDIGSARSWFDESLSVRKTLGDKLGRATAQLGMAYVALRQGDAASVRTLARSSIEQFAEAGDHWWQGVTTNLLGEMARVEGKLEEAERHYEESLGQMREAGDSLVASILLHNLAQIKLNRGEARAAEGLLRESLPLSYEFGLSTFIPYLLAGLGGVAAAERQPVRAARLLGAAERQLEATGNPMEPADRVPYDQRIAQVRSQLDPALFDKAWTEGRAMTLKQVIEYALSEDPPIQ